MIKITNNTSHEYNLNIFIGAIIRYIKLHYSLFGKYKGQLMQKPDSTVLKRISGTFKEFLEKENVHHLIPVFHLVHTAQGYGYVDEIGALYGLMWNTPTLLATTALKALGVEDDNLKLYILKNGHEHVWNTIVKKEKFDIQFKVDITSIHRNKNNVILNYDDGTGSILREGCDFLIWTPPMPDLLKHLSAPTNKEQSLFTTLKCHIWTKSLMQATNTIRNMPITYYVESIENKIDHEVLIDVDTEGALTYCDSDCPFSANNYSETNKLRRTISLSQFGQMPSSEAKLNEMAKSFYETRFNATNVEIFNTIQWNYFYKWNPHYLANGNHWKVFEIQGKHLVWYAGASVSFESLNNVMEYNRLLLRQLGNYAPILLLFI